MDLKEEIIKVFNKKDKLFEAMYRVVDSNTGHEIDILNSKKEVDEYNATHDDDDEYQIQPIGKVPKLEKGKKTYTGVYQEAQDFLNRYSAYRDGLDERIRICQYEDQSEYCEMVNDRNSILRSWWNSNIKLLSKAAHTLVNKMVKASKARLRESFIGDFEYKKPLNESQQKDFTFYKTLLEATFNPNVKSSWITQIWFEPNDDFLEDEEGNPIEINPKDPNLKGTVYMRVKNSKTGKVYPTYEFYDVPRKVYIMWRRARSKGKYFWRRMKYNYEG